MTEEEVEEQQRNDSEELLDEESLAVLAILLAVSLEFGFGFAKTVDWWAGLVAGPAALATLVTLFRLRPTHAWLVRAATWVVRTRSTGPTVAGESTAPRTPPRRKRERNLVPRRAWHEAAVKTRRQNAFDDYIAAARWLVSAGYTTPCQARLARQQQRRSARRRHRHASTRGLRSRLLPRAHPRHAALSEIRPQSAATVEYGSPDDPVEGAYLAGYSPYHNVRADRRYPVMMFVPALNDRIAPPHDPLKMVARLQAEATQGGPYLLLPLRDSGHGGGTTLTALIEQDVDELSFYCWALDVAPPSPGEAGQACSPDSVRRRRESTRASTGNADLLIAGTFRNWCSRQRVSSSFQACCCFREQSSSVKRGAGASDPGCSRSGRPAPEARPTHRASP